MVNRGVAHERQGRLDQAIRDYDEAVKLDPKDPVALNNRGNALLKKGQSVRAISDYDQSIRLDDKQPGTYFSRAIALESRRQYVAAVTDYDHVMRLQPANVAAWNSRCWTRAVIGQLPPALSDRNEALRLRPDFANALDSRGFVHLKSGRYDEAIATTMRRCGSMPKRLHRSMGAAWPSAGSTMSRAATPTSRRRGRSSLKCRWTSRAMASARRCPKCSAATWRRRRSLPSWATASKSPVRQISRRSRSC